MQTRNPFEPPTASLDAATASTHQPGLQYATFWQRLGAYLIDVLVLLPLMGVTYLASEKTRFFYLYWFVPGLVFAIWFHVYLVKRYGGTPGKLLLKTRIALVDGSPITIKAASIRYAVLLILSELGAIAMIMASFAMTDEMYFSLSFTARYEKLVELAPFWYSPVNVLMQIWIWSEFITILFNKRRRAVHDFIAGTVVVRTRTNA